MTLNDLLSVLAATISIISLYLTHQNKKEQQKLEKEMQQNELSFSRKKVWYEKQNEVIDTSIEKLLEIHKEVSKIEDFYIKWNFISKTKEIETVIEGEKKFKEQKMNKKEYFLLLDQIFDEKTFEDIQHIMQQKNESMELIYDNFAYLISRKHYFSKTIEDNIDTALNLTTNFLDQLEKEKVKEHDKEKVKSYFGSINAHIIEITNEIREEFINPVL